MKIYSVYDKQAESFSPPYTQPTDGLAIRQFSQHVNDPKLIMAKYPDDFELYCLGQIDESTGKFSYPDEGIYPALLIKAHQVLDNTNT